MPKNDPWEKHHVTQYCQVRFAIDEIVQKRHDE